VRSAGTARSLDGTALIGLPFHDADDVIRTAIDHTHVKADAVIAGAREIAFFPPMTGG